MPGDVPLYITDGPVPRDYVVPNSGELLPLQVEGTIDGTSAASSFYAVLQVLDPNGRSMGKYISSAIAAGASADVTWFPHVSLQAASSSGSGPAVLFDQTLTGVANSFSTGLNAIPQTHKDLLVVSFLRSNEAIANSGDGAIQFNGANVATHYKSQRWFVTATTGAGTTSAASAGINCLMVAGASADSGLFGASFAYIPNYTASTTHSVVGLEGSIPAFAATTNWRTAMASGVYNVAEPITSIVVIPNAGGGGQFVAGSRVTIYGLG